MKKLIQFQAQIDSVMKKKDKTLSIKLGTQELPPKDTAKIFDMDMLVWVAMSELTIEQQDLSIPDFVPEYKGEKSFSQRTKEVLYRLWEHVDNGKRKTSKQFYEDYMESIINNVKDKLN